MNQCKAIHYKKNTRKKYYNVPNKQKKKSIKFQDSYMPLQWNIPYGLEQ